MFFMLDSSVNAKNMIGMTTPKTYQKFHLP